jgi:hypothetical protein
MSSNTLNCKELFVMIINSNSFFMHLLCPDQLDSQFYLGDGDHVVLYNQSFVGLLLNNGKQ